MRGVVDGLLVARESGEALVPSLVVALTVLCILAAG